MKFGKWRKILTKKISRKKQAPKLMSPIRSFEGATRVIEAGADELYCGVVNPKIKDFVLYRGPKTEIQTYDELGRVVKYAHSREVDVIVTINQPYMVQEFESQLKSHLYSCLETGIDALIIGDLGIYSMARNHNANLSIYASTYMASMNYEAVNFLRKLGFNRVVLDRQLTVTEIREIAIRSQVPLEIFIHGGGCSNTNGNCFLYHFRFPEMERSIRKRMNESSVRSPCTLPFEVYDNCKQRKNHGTMSILDAFEVCSLCQLPTLMQLGVAGFKIEGRGESIFYQEETTRIYRRLIDLIMKDDLESFQKNLELIQKSFNPFPTTLLNISDALCEQKRCYYGPLFHAPYKTPISWKTWTKLQFVPHVFGSNQQK
jgi:putative protease